MIISLYLVLQDGSTLTNISLLSEAGMNTTKTTQMTPPSWLVVHETLEEWSSWCDEDTSNRSYVDDQEKTGQVQLREIYELLPRPFVHKTI